MDQLNRLSDPSIAVSMTKRPFPQFDFDDMQPDQVGWFLEPTDTGWRVHPQFPHEDDFDALADPANPEPIH